MSMSADSQSAPRAQLQPNLQPQPQPACRSICLLGDNGLLARDTAMRLRGAGYAVAVVTELAQLRPLLAQQAMGCILVDPSARDSRYADPACVARIRAQCPAPLPILWLAPVDSFEARLAAACAGADGYLAKPAQIGVLQERIEALVQRRDQQPYRVLLLGSDAARLAASGQALAQAGMEVIRLHKPLDLAGTLSRDHPEAVVLDVHTGACDGVDLAMLIRQDKTFLDLPVLVLSEDPAPPARRRALAAGVDDLLALPVAEEDLVFAVASRVERLRALRSLITRDGLSGLYNHAAIKEQALRELARSQREGSPLALAMIDIDFFKKINDSHGHPAGDQVIRAMAQLLQQRLRHGDLVGRYGGEEFAVILPGTTAPAAAGVLDEIRQAFGQLRHRAGEAVFSATFSAGVADLADLREVAGVGGAAELFRIADAALYQAKHGGRNRVELAGKQAGAA